MAAQPGPSTLPDRGVEDLVECPICYAPFERPLQLSCGHTLCGNCVDKLVENSRQNPHANLMVEFGGIDDELHRLMDPFQVPRPYRQVDPLGANPNNNNQQGLGGNLEAANPPRNQHFVRFANFGGWDAAPYDPLPNLPGPARILNPRRWQNVGGNGGGGDRNGTVIKCPECRAQTNVPVSGLPVNYRLQDMIARLNSSFAAANNGRKAPKVEVIKCERCSESLANGCYYVCKSAECVAAGGSNQMCATCGIRLHNGHVIEEVKVLTDRDVAEAKESIGLQTARATQALEQMQEKITELTIDARDQFVVRLQDSMKTFDNLASTMDNLLYNSLDSLTETIEKAQKVACKYEEMNNAVQQIVDGNKRQFESLDKVFNEFLREVGLGTRPIVKVEPMGEDDCVILEQPRTLADFGPRVTARMHEREQHRRGKLAKRREERFEALRVNNQRNSVEEREMPPRPPPVGLRRPSVSPPPPRSPDPETNDSPNRSPPPAPADNNNEQLARLRNLLAGPPGADQIEPMRERAERLSLVGGGHMPVRELTVNATANPRRRVRVTMRAVQTARGGPHVAEESDDRDDRRKRVRNMETTRDRERRIRFSRVMERARNEMLMDAGHGREVRDSPQSPERAMSPLPPPASPSPTTSPLRVTGDDDSNSRGSSSNEMLLNTPGPSGLNNTGLQQD